MVTPYYEVASYPSDSPLADGAKSDIRLDRVALLFTNVSIVGDFQPESLWNCSRKIWRCDAPSFKGASLSQFREAFQTAVEQSIGNAAAAAVSFSGGLDSLAVLHCASKFCSRTGRDCIAITANLTDDSGDPAECISRELIRRFHIDCKHLILDPRAATLPPRWSPFGPRLEAMPSLTRYISDSAEDAGAEILLHGNGADGLLGTPRYLFHHLFGNGYLRKAIRYAQDALSQGILPVCHELRAAFSRCLPKRIRYCAYWPSNWPELCDPEPSAALNESFKSIARDWSREWILARLESHITSSRTWAHADAWDNMYPHELFPPSGRIPEQNPFLENSFVNTAQRVALHERYAANCSCAYHRQKALVLALYDPSDHSLLPSAKQIFSRAFADQLGVYPDPILSKELGVIDDKSAYSVTDPKVHHRIRAVEEWLREAKSLGYQFVASTTDN